MAKRNKNIISGEQLDLRIIDIYKDGGNVKDVENYLTSIGREKSIRSDIFSANQKINADAKKEREVLINTHVKRYQKMFNDNISKIFDSPEIARFPANIRKFALIDSYMIALDALIAKEKVLGLHTKQFRIQLNNFFKKRIVAQYDFNGQDFNDLIRLKYLLDKMKLRDTNVVQYFDDLAEETKDAQKIQDADYIIINDSVSDKIKEKITPIPRDTDQKLLVEEIKEKIIKEDLKKHDHNRNKLLDKLKKL